MPVAFSKAAVLPKSMPSPILQNFHRLIFHLNFLLKLTLKLRISPCCYES